MKEFKNVIAYESEKQEMYRILDILINYDKYKKIGARIPSGLLLHGDPGVGKTLMANCFVKASKRKAFVLRKKRSEGRFIDEIENTFRKASKNSPSIVFLDDMDKYSSEDSECGNPEAYVTIQTCIDEYAGCDVFVIATANNLFNMPDSLIREGRFDILIEIENPRGHDAELIVKHYLKNKKCDKTVNSVEIAKLLDGRSCAVLEHITNEAAVYAGYDNREKISKDDLIRAFMRFIYRMPENNQRKSSLYLKEAAYHEAGHALVSELLNKGSVNFATIANSDSDIAGITNTSKNKDYSYDVNFMKNEVMILLAGRAAIEVAFGKIDPCTQDDLSRAFATMRWLVSNCCIHGFRFRETTDCSQFTKEKIENDIADEMEKLYFETKRIIADNRILLDKIANKLMTETVVFGGEIQEIVQINMEATTL